MVFFAITGEYGVGDGTNFACEHRLGKWFRQVIPAGSQIDLLRQEIRRYCIRHARKTEQISDWRITLSSTGFHFDPLGLSGYPLEDAEEFVKLEGFTPVLQHMGFQDTSRPDTNIFVRAEEPAACVLHNAQAQAPDIQAANGEGKATCFQRATDSTESLNDPAPAAGSSPWRPASLPFTFFDDTPYILTGRWFRQITPLGIRNTNSLGTNVILKAPMLSHIFGALGPMPQVAPQLFHRAAEVALGGSLNAQSQAPDIPGVPSRAVSSRYAASLQAQSLAPDIQLVSLRAYLEELSASFNAQDQAPDDSYAQDRRCAPSIFDIPRKGRQVLARSLTKQDILHLFLQLEPHDSAQELFRRTSAPYIGASRIEFQFRCLWIRFAIQGVVCFHSVDFGGHVQHSQCAPCIFVDNQRKGLLARPHTKQVISHFFLHLRSQDSAQELFQRTNTSNHGVSRIEFQFCCLRTLFVSQGVVCLHSVGFGGPWICPVIFLDVSRGSTLCVSLYISFA